MKHGWYKIKLNEMSLQSSPNKLVQHFHSFHWTLCFRFDKNVLQYNKRLQNHLIQDICQPKIDWGIDNIKFPASLFCECAQSSLYSSQGRGFVKSSCQLPSLQLLGVERRLFKSIESNPCCFSQTFMSSRWPRVILSLLAVNVNLTSPLHN